MSVGNDPKAITSWVTHLVLTPSIFPTSCDLHICASGLSLRRSTMAPPSVMISKSLVSDTAFSSESCTATLVPFT